LCEFAGRSAAAVQFFFAPFFFRKKMEAPLAGDPDNERGVFFKMIKKMASMAG
jgi:hypothetical protein